MHDFFDFEIDDSNQPPPPAKKVVAKVEGGIFKAIVRTDYTFDREKVFNTPGHTFQFKGITYECIGEDKDFQITQFRFCVEVREWVTLNNRINNQLRFGPNIKKI